jgi:hypothetical protein
MHQWKGAVHPLALTDQEMFNPLPVLSFITLITYQLSFYSCSVLPWLALAYPPSQHLTAPYCWLINIRDSVFLRFHSCLLSSRTNHFLFVFYQKFFQFPPHVSCLSLFTFHSTLHPSWLPSASLLHLPVFVLCVASVSVAVRVSWTEGERVWSKVRHNPSEPYPDAECKQVSACPPRLKAQ